jgi:hypothetical protein
MFLQHIFTPWAWSKRRVKAVRLYIPKRYNANVIRAPRVTIAAPTGYATVNKIMPSNMRVAANSLAEFASYPKANFDTACNTLHPVNMTRFNA